MPRNVKLDLRGSPPVVTGSQRDHIPPGRYRCTVTRVEATTSASGKAMWTGSYKVSAGSEAGANLGDNFVLEDNNKQPSRMGIGRLHHFLLCLGLPVKEAVVNLDLDRLSGLEVEVEVTDGEYTTSSGVTRASSDVKGYAPVSKVSGNGTFEPVASMAPVETPPIPEETTEPEDEDEEDENDEEDEALTEVESEIDDLFK